MTKFCWWWIGVIELKSHGKPIVFLYLVPEFSTSRSLKILMLFAVRIGGELHSFVKFHFPTSRLLFASSNLAHEGSTQPSVTYDELVHICSHNYTYTEVGLYDVVSGLSTVCLCPIFPL